MRFRLVALLAILLTFGFTAKATDITIASTTVPNFNPSNIGSTVNLSSITVTNGSPTVTCSACFRPSWVGIGGFTIAISGVNHTVLNVASTSSLTLTANYGGASVANATIAWYPYAELRFYADRAFQPLGASYIVQPGTPGTGAWYKRYAVSILDVSSVKTLYLPEIVLPATTDSPGPTNQARFSAAFYRPDNSLIQFYACFEQFRIPAITPTSWTALCAYNSPPAIVPPANEAYTKTQIDARFPSCTIGQMLYYAATGNAQSCLTVGAGLSISGGTITASGAVSGTDVRQAVNANDYGCDLTDSATDDTTCLNNAITAAQGAKNKILYLPGGYYNVTTTITIPGGLIVEGDGRTKTFIKSNANAIILDLVQGTGDHLYHGPVLRDLAVVGDIAAGSSQVGIRATDASYMFNTVISRVNVSNTGGSGLSIGNVYSSYFSDLFLGNSATGWPLLYDAANMPENLFDKIYVGSLISQGGGYNTAGYRIKAGDFVCNSCNGINNVVADSKWAVVGKKNGTDGDVANGSASFTCVDCNFETWVKNGVLAYYGSFVNVRGASTFAMDASGAGTGKPVEFEHINNGSDYYAELVRRGYIEDSVVFSNALSAYANNQAIHSNGFAPIQTLGRGPSVAGGNTLGTFYNSTAGATAYLSRADGAARKITVTASTSFTDPTVRYIEANCAAACTITLPWPAWYQNAQETVIIKDISGNASTNNITIASNSGGTVNGSTYVLKKNGGSVVLVPDGGAAPGDWRVASAYVATATDIRNAINAADFGCDLADNATDDTACVAAAITAAKASAGKTLYFPKGTYNTDPITASLGGLTLTGDGPTNSILKAFANDQNIISLTGAGYASNLVIRDLGFSGKGKAAGDTGHCIYINDSVSYLSQFEFNNLEIKNCRQNGLYVPYIFNGVIRRVTTDEIGGNHFDLGPANTVTMEGNYVQTVEARQVGYRLRGGTYTVISNNGLDPDSASTAFWGIFGSKAVVTTCDTANGSAIVTDVVAASSLHIGDEITITGAGPSGTDLTVFVTFVNAGANIINISTTASADLNDAALVSTDGADSYFRGAFIGNNVESFGNHGLRLKENSKLGTISGNSFTTDANAITHIALKYDYAGGNVPAGTWDQTNDTTLTAGTWKDGAAIHSQGVPFYVYGGIPAQYYETSFPALVDLPTTIASWDGGFNEMFARTPNLQGDYIKAGVGGTTTGQILFQNAGNSNRLILQAGLTGSNLTFTLPIADGSASQCLITNGAGVLSFGACGGSSLPVVDTTGIAKGSVDATKLVRFEVDGFTTGTTRVLTPPDADIVIAGSASALTSGRVPYVTTGGLLTDSARLLWDNATYKMTLGNASTASVLLQGGGGNNVGHPGTGYGLLMPYVGGSQSGGPGIWWVDETAPSDYSQLFGMWLNLGLNIQGTGGVANVKIRKATDTSSDGDIVFDLRPNDGRLDMYPYGASAGNTTLISFRELAANGTNYVSFKGPDSIAADITWTLPATDSTGSQCLASNGSGTLSWSACSGGGGTPGGSNKQVQFNNSSAFGGAAGFEYQSGASPNVSITAQNAAYVPLYVNGASSQTANLQQWAVNSVTYNVVTKDGYLYLGRGETSATPSGGRIYATGGSGTNIAGGSLVLYGGAGTGSGAGGSIAFYTAAAGGSGSTPNTPVIQYELDQKGNHFFGNAQLVQAATDGFVHIPGIANVPSGVPTLITGLVPLAVDETNYRLYGYSGGAWRNLTGAASGLTVGTTAITSGTAGRILYETTGNVLGEIAGSSADANGAVQFAATARTSGVAQYFRINTPADTTLTASTESVGAYFGGNGSGSTVTRQWASGAGGITTQRENIFVGPTYAFDGTARTITKAANVAIGNLAAGTGASYTNAYTLVLGPLESASAASSRYGGNSAVGTTSLLLATGGDSEIFLGVQTSGEPRITLGKGSQGAFWKVGNGFCYFGGQASNNLTLYSGGSARALWDTTGLLTLGTNSAASAQVHIISQSASRVGLRVDSASTPSADIVQFTNNGTNYWQLGSAGAVTMTSQTANTSTVATAKTINVNSTGTAATGFGGQLLFQLESSTTNQQNAGALNWLWTDATHASRTSALTMSLVRNAGSLTEAWRLSATNSSTTPQIQQQLTGPNGGTQAIGVITESVTLNTGGTTTDSTIDLPANSIILSVTGRITTTITTATDWKLGDATISDRFSDANATLTAGTTTVGINQWKADRTTAGQGAFQQSTAKVRITTTGTPGAGVIRITIHYITLSAPTS